MQELLEHVYNFYLAKFKQSFNASIFVSKVKV